MSRNLYRAAMAAVTRATPRLLETLESRTLLCVSPASYGLLDPTRNDPSVVALVQQLDTDGDGHLTQQQFQTLSPDVQAQIDPHLVEADDAPVDFDKILGLPKYLTAPESTPEAIALPDFFPQLDSAITVDQTSQPGRTLLRFGTQVNNQGAGPAILISGRPGVDPIPTGAPITSWVNPDGSQNVLQAVYDFTPGPGTGGSFALAYYRAGGQFTYHQAHSHFHFDGYATYRLRHNNGGVPGAYVQRPDGSGVVGEKTGFCLINTSSSFTTEWGASSTTLPGYSATGQPGTGCGLIQGVKVGHADEYSSGLTGQWIDVTGVPNGSYFLELGLDGEDAVLETNEGNNAKNFAYNLNVNPPAGGIQPDVFESNDTFATAHNMGALGPKLQTGLTIHWGLDYDYFRFTATSSGPGTIITTQANGNIDLYLYDASQTLLASSTLDGSASDSITHNFVAGQTYYVKTQSYNSTVSSNYQIEWRIKPQVNAIAQVPTASVVNGPGEFRITRNGPTDEGLNVNLTYGGTAVVGVDYNALPSTVTFGTLDSFVEIPVAIRSGATLAVNKTVIVNVSSNSAYAIGNGQATITLLENVKPTVISHTFQHAGVPQSIRVRFSEDVSASIQPEDLVLRRDFNGQTFEADSVSWESGTNTAVFFFNTMLPNGNYTSSIAASEITDAAGNPLAAPTQLFFRFLQGDANGDGVIDFDDYALIDNGFLNGLSGYGNGDFNNDGVIDFDDYALIDTNYLLQGSIL
jgi:hypothetical protein